MKDKRLDKKHREFDNSVKSEGICCIETSKGIMTQSYGMTADAESIVELKLNKNEFQGLNSQFNTFFYDRGFPKLISAKNKNNTRVIHFSDKDHLLCAITKNESVNYIKIKSQLNKISL